MNIICLLWGIQIVVWQMAKRRLSIYLFLHVDAFSSLFYLPCRLPVRHRQDNHDCVYICVVHKQIVATTTPPLLPCILMQSLHCLFSPLHSNSVVNCVHRRWPIGSVFVSRNFRNSHALPQKPRPEPASTSQRLCSKRGKG